MRRVKILPAARYLRDCLRYDCDSGELYWNHRPRSHFVSEKAFNWWNTRYSEERAFTAINPSGYRFGSINNEHYLAHRVIWKIVTGKEPPALVDHKDKSKLNNRWENLREATKSQNNANSIALGVHFDKSRNRWQAHGKINRRRIHFGRFDTKEEELAARAAGMKRLFGEFAP